jgi:hypothetical protein
MHLRRELDRMLLAIPIQLNGTIAPHARERIDGMRARSVKQRFEGVTQPVVMAKASSISFCAMTIVLMHSKFV